MPSKSLCLAASLFLSVPAWAQPPEPKPEIEKIALPQEIRSTLEQFVWSLNLRSPYEEFDGARYVEGAKVGYYGAREWIALWLEDYPGATLQLENLKVVELKSDSARVQVFFHWVAKGFQSQGYAETLELRRNLQLGKEGRPLWRIAPRADSFETFGRVLNAIVNPQSALAEARWQRARSQLAALSSGVRRFAEIHNNNYAFAPELVRAAILPILSNFSISDSVWTVSGTNQSWTFNPHLSGKSFDSLKNPTQTVMFYEGQDEKPVFRYDGKAAIGFAEGGARLVTSDEAKNLIWAP